MKHTKIFFLFLIFLIASCGEYAKDNESEEGYDPYKLFPQLKGEIKAVWNDAAGDGYYHFLVYEKNRYRMKTIKKGENKSVMIDDLMNPEILENGSVKYELETELQQPVQGMFYLIKEDWTLELYDENYMSNTDSGIMTTAIHDTMASIDQSKQ